MASRSYTDEDLVQAIAGSRSWRGTLRTLGLVGTSSGSMRSVRARADDLGIDYGHFTGQRRWTDDALRGAVASATPWTDVARGLGLRGGGVISGLKGHAVRLGLDLAHFDSEVPDLVDSGLAPTTVRLDRAGAFIAAAWFTLCGREVSWPLEPCRYDLIVRLSTSAES